MKCKRCKKGNLFFIINIGDEYKENKFKKKGEVYVCDNCGKCLILKLKEVKQ